MNYLLSNRTRRLFAIFHRHEWDDFQVKQFSKKFFNDSENDFFFRFRFSSRCSMVPLSIYPSRSSCVRLFLTSLGWQCYDRKVAESPRVMIQLASFLPWVDCCTVTKSELRSRLKESTALKVHFAGSLWASGQWSILLFFANSFSCLYNLIFAI